MFRYVLIDYMHLAHKCMVAEALSTTVNIGGEMRIINTTVPNYTIKDIYRIGERGRFAVAVCLEGGNSKRKEYFAQGVGGKGAKVGYKGGRSSHQNEFYEGVNLATNLLVQGGVSVYRAQGLEADDCIASLVKKIKMVDDITPIDIITNDSDLLPLVDEQVSVYMRGNREHAEEGCPTRRLYYQVTPETWTEYLSYASAYKGFLIPYNSMLLFKLIRGDKADNIPPSIKGYGGVKYSKLMEEMIEEGVDFETIFRYGNDFDEVMRPVLECYFDTEVVNHMKFIYEGINPYHANLELPKQIDIGTLQQALLPLRINLPR